MVEVGLKAGRENINAPYNRLDLGHWVQNISSLGRNFQFVLINDRLFSLNQHCYDYYYHYHYYYYYY